MKKGKFWMMHFRKPLTAKASSIICNPAPCMRLSNDEIHHLKQHPQRKKPNQQRTPTQALLPRSPTRLTSGSRSTAQRHNRKRRRRRGDRCWSTVGVAHPRHLGNLRAAHCRAGCESRVCGSSGWCSYAWGSPAEAIIGGRELDADEAGDGAGAGGGGCAVRKRTLGCG